MAKFNKYDFVKFKEEYYDKFRVGLPCNPMIVMNIVKLDDETEVYGLLDWIDFEKYGSVPEDWLESVVSPIPQGTKLPISGFAISAEELNKFSVQEEKTTVSILGTTYTIQELSVAEDISLKDCDGYCDKTDKRIVIAKKEADCDLGDFEQHRKKTMRHEVLHAFFNESGLAENFENKRYGIPETLVDWFAIQSPKIYKTFAELDIL